jgi:hypothetical protein
LLSYSTLDYITEYLGYKAAGSSPATLTIPQIYRETGVAESIRSG